MVYVKTIWINDETPVNANNMNKIETALEELANTTISANERITNAQIDDLFGDI